MHPLPKGAIPLDVATAPHGEWVAVSGQDNVVRVLNTVDGKPLATMKAQAGWPRTIAVSPDGRWLAAADGSGINLWDTQSWRLTKRLKHPADTVTFAADSRTLIGTMRWPADDGPTSGQGLLALLWDIETGSITNQVRVPGWRIQHAVPSPDGKRLACACAKIVDSLIHCAFLVKTSSSQIIDELAADFEDINDFAFLPEGTIAVAVFGHHYKPVMLWKTR